MYALIDFLTDLPLTDVYCDTDLVHSVLNHLS